MELNRFLIFFFTLLILAACKKENTEDDTPQPTYATTAQFYKPTFSLAVGGREKVMLTLDTENAILKNAKWTSANTSVAKVDADGVVIALAKGETIISLSADNNISGSCIITVVDSPIKDLVMPEGKYPLAKDALIFIQGSGFTSNSKIIFRPRSDYKQGLKSASDAGDILAQIREIALNHISLYLALNPGWYDVVLNESNKEFDLGNIKVETPNIPEFEYDKNKIFWEDTHWRRFQLRGKVKKITITSKWPNVYRGVDIDSEAYNFNRNGYLLSNTNRGGWSDSIAYEYDSKNRPVLVTEYESNRKTSWKYTYGNHNLFLPIQLQLIADSYWNSIVGDIICNNRDFWVRGLEKVEYVFDGEWGFDGAILHNASTCQFKQSSNSIIGTESSIFAGKPNAEYTYTYTYNGIYPEKLITKYKYYSTMSNWDEYPTIYEFTKSGMPVKYVTTNSAGRVYREEFVQNTPFYLHSVYDTWGYGHAEYEYDKNMNLTTHTQSAGSDVFKVYYTSYDSEGNWTQCKFTQSWDGDSPELVTVTRDITYW